MCGINIRAFCSLFCCPPLPSSIVAKIAFVPPVPTYSFSEVSSNSYRIHFLKEARWGFLEKDKLSIEGLFSFTSKGNKIACVFVKCCEDPRFTILFSHSNAVDLGLMCSYYLWLGVRIKCNIFSYDYSGYGLSSGKPSEKNMYADISSAWDCLRMRFNITPEKIILYGQSIGTVPTVDLASRVEFGAVILHSPFTSAIRLMCPNTKRSCSCDCFSNIDKITKVTSPVLIIHGTADEVVDFSHAEVLFEKCQNPVYPLWVEGGGHNDIPYFTQYVDRLKHFLTVEVGKPNLWSPVN